MLQSKALTFLTSNFLRPCLKRFSTGPVALRCLKGLQGVRHKTKIKSALGKLGK